MTYRIGYIVGSLSKESINRKVAKALAELAGDELEFNEISIAELPLFSPELEAELPEQIVNFKQQIESSDAIVVLTPEYNRSFPGVLKNAIDIASRPWGKNSFAGKPGAIMGASISNLGTAMAQNQLRGVLSFLGMDLLHLPEIYLTIGAASFNGDGKITDLSMEERLIQWLADFTDHLHRHLG